MGLPPGPLTFSSPLDNLDRLDDELNAEVIDLSPHEVSCVVCGVITDDSHGIPMYEDLVLPDDWTGEWFGQPACRRCHAAQSRLSNFMSIRLFGIKLLQNWRSQKPAWRRWHLCIINDPREEYKPANCDDDVRKHDLVVAFLEAHETQYRGWTPFWGYDETLKLAIAWDDGCRFCGERRHASPCRHTGEIGRCGCRHNPKIWVRRSWAVPLLCEGDR